MKNVRENKIYIAKIMKKHINEDVSKSIKEFVDNNY